jgi:hypothetical protein
MKFNIGDYVYYRDKEGDTYPCKVVKIGKKRIKIDAGFRDNSFVRWVNPGNCELQSE